jgi:GLPGLI family protein
VYSIKAQEKTMRVSYINFNDTIVPEDKKYTTTVLINGNKSVSYKLPYIMKKPGAYLVSNSNGKQKYEFYSETDSVKKYIYKNFDKDSMFFQSEIDLLIVKASKTYSDSLHPFSWKILNETKKLGNQVCRKATMWFRGRNYSAWFDEAVNVSNGPWKYGGLPGLIMEIYDDTFTVYWTISKIDYIEMPSFPELPTDITETYSDFKKMYKERFDKIKKSFESSDGLSDPNCTSCIGNRKTITNNSVENLLQE